MSHQDYLDGQDDDDDDKQNYDQNIEFPVHFHMFIIIGISLLPQILGKAGSRQPHRGWRVRRNRTICTETSTRTL